MRTALVFAPLIAALLVAGCGRAGPTATADPGASPSPTVFLAGAEPLGLPASAAATPTSLAEGMNVRLSTPDPSPNCPDHYPWFFENRAQECAAFILNTWTVAQPFEHGLLVWTQERGRTYVLLDDGSPIKPYVLVSDPVGVPLPGPDPSIVPPEGLFQPELGFALYWRNLVPGHEWVRERLGWATAPETAYSGFLQCNTATGEAARCYLNGPRDEIIVFTQGPALYWTYWQTAVR